MNERRPRWTPLIEWASSGPASSLPSCRRPAAATTAAAAGWARPAYRHRRVDLGEWRRFKSTKGDPKHTITERKVRQVLEAEDMPSFEALHT